MTVLGYVRASAWNSRTVTYLVAPSHPSDCMQASSFVGAIVNVLRVPEKWFHDSAAAAEGKRVAGLFDYWLNSHQIMHIMVTIGILNLWWGANDDYQHWESHLGTCQLPGL